MRSPTRSSAVAIAAAAAIPDAKSAAPTPPSSAAMTASACTYVGLSGREYTSLWIPPGAARCCCCVGASAAAAAVTATSAFVFAALAAPPASLTAAAAACCCCSCRVPVGNVASPRSGLGVTSHPGDPYKPQRPAYLYTLVKRTLTLLKIAQNDKVEHIFFFLWHVGVSLGGGSHCKWYKPLLPWLVRLEVAAVRGGGVDGRDDAAHGVGGTS
jgi:hypothetical protein